MYTERFIEYRLSKRFVKKVKGCDRWSESKLLRSVNVTW
jgi:hypothetical protein